MADAYLTISSITEGVYKEKGSKFLGFAHPITTENEVKEILEKIKKRYYDASHHCYAYRIGVEQEKTRAYDDGEPAHTAGTPILGQIRSKNLTNVLIIVVRYFGGTKLGVGGLITAYKNAAAEALANAQIIEKRILLKLLIQFDYSHTNDVMGLLKQYKIKILSQKFDTSSELVIEGTKNTLSEIKQKLMNEASYIGEYL